MATWTSRHTGETYAVIKQYDRTHVVVGVIGLIVSGIIVVAARRTRDIPWVRRARQITAVLIGVTALAYLAYTLKHGNLVADETLPFHVSDWLRYIAPIALLNGNEYAVAITYFWGFVLNPMALLTPDAAWVLDRRIQETAYWVFHWIALIIPAVMTFSYGARPTWKGYGFTAVFSAGWMAAAGVANKVTGGNYGFLARKPRGSSIIDYLGPWPWNILVEMVLVAAAWAGMTWVWERKPAGKLSPKGLVRWAS